MRPTIWIRSTKYRQSKAKHFQKVNNCGLHISPMRGITVEKRLQKNGGKKNTLHKISVKTFQGYVAQRKTPHVSEVARVTLPGISWLKGNLQKKTLDVYLGDSTWWVKSGSPGTDLHPTLLRSIDTQVRTCFHSCSAVVKSISSNQDPAEFCLLEERKCSDEHEQKWFVSSATSVKSPQLELSLPETLAVWRPSTTLHLLGKLN